MSAASTPLSAGRYVSPSPVPGYGHSPSPVPFVPRASPPAPGSATSSKPSGPKVKPANVFSNDGSFLERFQRIKQEEDEKKKQEEALARKRTFDERFKKRGKRASPEATVPTDTTDEPAVKKAKSDKPLTDYERQVKSYGTSLKDSGIGVRPLVK
ncbi:hypothetical protein GLOTRDRAFT_130030 [Gloeophyllum trabeum ATCC 11539]|uniref:Uncharacterized protein n=1 Tax=Gloeophyllum trabeum (strain ATCC 11539 / FP-39264 / Madison 617) TaxID=670483 RepID=S7RJX7_GLOTA|nr:uncharacterized protein GLOTRDRAFT_130030 [Gloeophyllum trabeum ATCC 11539]EPQ54680.1 hypothetical protein GLOTRDRAFT_130030 [Gloeophyllum trabeum ATCC 11539]